MADDPIRVERITVGADRMTLLVTLAPETPRTSDAALAARLLAAYPELAHHRCANDRGPLLASVIADTPVPHLLEHLIISELARDDRTPRSAALVGATAWLNREEGRARVEVSFTDDIVALEAIGRAQRFLCGCLNEPTKR